MADSPTYNLGQIPDEKDISYFGDRAVLMSRDDLRKHPPPAGAGVYGWYFSERPPLLPKRDYPYRRSFPFTKWELLYVGRASSIRGRLSDEHFDGQPVRGQCLSTLRLSLGCLLSRDLGICLRKDRDFYSFGAQGEEALTKWIVKHARVAWVESDLQSYGRLEEAVISRYNPPLNLKGQRGDFMDALKELRRSFRRHAIRVRTRRFTEECGFDPEAVAISAAYRGLKN